MTIAKTILEQLGGQRFVAMTGAKHLLDCGNALQFTLPNRFAKNGINKVAIELNANDTYTVTFYKYNSRKLEAKIIKKVPFVFVDNLRQVFTENTGLYTNL